LSPRRKRKIDLSSTALGTALGTISGLPTMMGDETQSIQTSTFWPIAHYVGIWMLLLFSSSSVYDVKTISHDNHKQVMIV
jgi:hypothetical protein